MGAQRSPEERHDEHYSERVRLASLRRHEEKIRERERARLLAHLGVPMTPEPADPDVFVEGCVI